MSSYGKATPLLEVENAKDSGQSSFGRASPLVKEENPPQGAIANIEAAIPNVVSEFAAAFNKPVAELVDFLGVDTINAATSLAEKGLNKIGVDVDIPEVPRLSDEIPGIQGGFMDEGLAKDVVRGAGTASSLGLGGSTTLAKVGAKVLPSQTVKKGVGIVPESVGQGTLRQLLTQTAPVEEAVLSAVAGGGAVIGKELGGGIGEEKGSAIGEVLGGLLAPLSLSLAKETGKTIWDLGSDGITAVVNSFKNSGMSEDGASSLLAEAMVRDGISPEEAVKRLTDLGDEAIPADIGDTFARLLRLASNRIPRVEGVARARLDRRQEGQSQRVIDAMDDATGTSGLNVSDEIARLDATLKPEINRLYEETRTKGVRLSDRLIKLLKSPENSLGKAARKAQQTLADKRAVGDSIGNIDLIDATKEKLDDQIGKALRQGENNRARDLVRLKNLMLEEVDATVPQYKEARNLYAGKIQLQNAAEAGSMFLSKKMTAGDISDMVKNMGESEKKLFKLGAKQAVLDKMDDIQSNRDMVKVLFGKNGDIKKISALFDDQKAFDKFSDALKKEAQFIVTKNQAVGNSTTFKQQSDSRTFEEAFNSARLLSGDPTAAATTFGKIVSRLSTGSGDDFNKALSDAADILLAKGVNPDKLEGLLRAGNAKEIRNLLEQTLLRAEPDISGKMIRTGSAAVVGQIQNQKESKQKEQ